MPAGKWKINIEQGATYRRVLRVKDPDGAALDLTGYTARMQMRATVDAVDPPLLELTTENDGLTIDEDAGTVTILITDETTTAITWRRAVYDLEIVSAGGEVTRLVGGHVTVSPEVTR